VINSTGNSQLQSRQECTQNRQQDITGQNEEKTAKQTRKKKIDKPRFTTLRHELLKICVHLETDFAAEIIWLKGSV
jgi:hypothetical protein